MECQAQWEWDIGGIQLQPQAHNTSEHAIYPHGKGASRLPMEVYINNLIITENDVHKIAKFKQEMTVRFKMSDLEKQPIRPFFGKKKQLCMNSDFQIIWTVSVSELDLPLRQNF